MMKERRVVIVNIPEASILPLRLVVPLTDWQQSFTPRKWMVRLEPSPTNGITKTVAADTFQTRCISTDRFNLKVRRLGKLSDQEMQQIIAAIRAVTGG
jgi:mRNA interferase MazF